MDNGEVRIVTDSTALVSAEERELHNISVIPLKVIFGAEVYSEGIDITNEDFYRRLAGRGVLPTTSQPPVDDFIHIYRSLAEAGHPILSLHISSRLSGTVNSARLARDKLPQARIEIVDCLTVALRMLIGPAVRAAEAGYRLARLKEYIEKLNAGMNAFGALGTLEYLAKGGRIGVARALLGTVLKIKPLLAFEGGELHVLSRARTSAKAIDSIVEMMNRRISGESPIYVDVVHTKNLEPALLLKERVAEEFNCVDLELIELGPVLASHLGPGFFGIGFYGEEIVR
ncbi:MAG: DegV family protein [Dehalococcoidales bacterium]